MSAIIQAVKKNLDITQNKPLKISLYEAFRKTIILGEIPAGTRINEKEFSTELNISRTPIRYALNELTKEHLVEHIPKIGVIVKGISIKDAHEIYERSLQRVERYPRRMRTPQQRRQSRRSTCKLHHV